jgi:hypothetical protein
MENTKKSILLPVLLLLITSIPILQACLKEPEAHVYSIPEVENFTIRPSNPDSKDEVSMITYDCKYYVLASVISKQKEITVKKRFNSQMKWPCILHYDTISLGRLSQGTYKIIMLIVDTNPMVKDSISVQQTLALEVGK